MYLLILLVLVSRWDPLIEEMAIAEGVPARIARALVDAESGGNPNAVSRSGAVGLVQLMPGTAKMYGVTDRRSPRQNLRAGLRHLRRLRDRLGSWRLAVAAYNCGELPVLIHKGVPPYPETRRHVQRVCGQGRC